MIAVLSYFFFTKLLILERTSLVLMVKVCQILNILLKTFHDCCMFFLFLSVCAEAKEKLWYTCYEMKLDPFNFPSLQLVFY